MNKTENDMKIQKYLVVMIAFVSSSVAFGENDSNHMPIKELHEYEKSLNENDYDEITDKIPDAIVNEVAKRAGVDPSKIKPMISGEYKRISNDLKIKNFKIMTDQTKDGTLQDQTRYINAPSTLNMTDSNGNSINLNSSIFGINKDGKWYFVRSDDAYFMDLWKSKIDGVEEIKIIPPSIKRD